MSQDDLAVLSGVGRRTITRWENEGDVAPTVEQVMAVVDALAIPRETAFRTLGWLADDEAGTTPQPEPTWRELAERMKWHLAEANRIWEVLQEMDRRKHAG